MKNRTIAQRAVKYAQGKVHALKTPTYEAPLAQGWHDGYRAALRDVTQIGTGLTYATSRELSDALDSVIDRAVVTFREELGKIE